MDNINNKYEQILTPNEFVKNFNSLSEFRLWCEYGSVLDLEECLKVFEYHELFEYCAIIKSVKDDKSKL